MIPDRLLWVALILAVAAIPGVALAAVLRGYHLHMTRPGHDCPQCGRRD